jgi:aminoglycoside phosphotransferase family enzyme/predicted kinase
VPPDQSLGWTVVVGGSFAMKLLDKTADGTTEGFELKPPWWEDVLSPAAYPESTRQVLVKETHISWVFLTDRHAYKVRKPVKFSFLNFESLEQRLDDCQREVDLNRRLAPQIYLGVVPLVRTAHGHYCFGGRGTTVEYAVKMVRLPEEACLAGILERRALSTKELAGLSRVLLAFYQNLPPVTLTAEEYYRRVERHVMENDADLKTILGSQHEALLRRLLQVQLLYLRLFRDRLEARVSDGRIVEGHGDLRPEHIYLLAKPVVIDAVEFSTELRQLDVLDELAFLAMECDRMGHTALGNYVLDFYTAESGDSKDDRLWNFYKVYRALVRAKVHALQSRQCSGTAQRRALACAHDYLLLAEQYADAVTPPILFVVGGISGSGKSTLAEQLATAFAARRYSTDEIRATAFAAMGNSATADKYSINGRDRVYQLLMAQAEQELRQGLSVVVDGTFLARSWRRQAQELAKRWGAACCFIQCDCPVGLASIRVANRYAGASEATPDLPAQQFAQLQSEPWTEPGFRVDTTACLGAELQDVYRGLRNLLEKGPSESALNQNP